MLPPSCRCTDLHNVRPLHTANHAVMRHNLFFFPPSLWHRGLVAPPRQSISPASLQTKSTTFRHAAAPKGLADCRHSRPLIAGCVCWWLARRPLCSLAGSALDLICITQSSDVVTQINSVFVANAASSGFFFPAPLMASLPFWSCCICVSCTLAAQVRPDLPR